MDISTRLSQLLSSTPVVPNYSNKWSHHGRRLIHQSMSKEKITKTEKSICFDIGQPNTTLSPVKGIKIQLSSGEEIALEKNHLENLSLYKESEGLPELRQWLLEIQRREHSPPQMVMDNHPSKFDLCLVTGATDAIYVCYKNMMDEGDTILMENITYINFIFSVKSQGMNIQGVRCDDKGMIPEALEDELSNWDKRHPGKKRPHLMYTVTCASNPIGYNWCLGRMLDIYLICRKYDILIMDDGAYHFLQYKEDFRSFQSFDVDGRVIRFDTFSKTMGAGYRVGWVSGPEAIIDKFIINNEMTCVHPSILAQATLYSIVKNWGFDGFKKHTRTVADFYRKRSECVVNACDKYLKGLATWTVPKGGMFTWITIKDNDIGGQEISDELKKNHDIRMIGGDLFQTDPSLFCRSIRVSFSLVSEEDAVKGIKCLADVIQKRVDQGKLQNGVGH